MACTFFPEGDWKPCCQIHDEQYSKGSKVPRKVADRALRDCVASSGHPRIAKVMYAGIRSFGWMFYKGNK